MNLENNWQSTVYSDGSKFFVSNPLPKKGETITIALQVKEDSPVTNVFLSGKKNGTTRPEHMTLVSNQNGLSRYETSIQIFEKEFSYQFFVVTSDKIYYYTQSGLHTHMQNEAFNFRILTDYQQPEWVKNAVFYQIFPERFCNGDPSLNIKDGEYQFDGYPTQFIKDWNSVPEEYEKAHCLDFYGGDLYGIKQKIPYLKKLGITAIYLNPIFYAATVHKYDCLDYFHVDPHFGGDKALVELVEELHKNGMKIILDVSINHTGIANRWFNRDATFFPKYEGAYNNPDSEEREYYFFAEDGKSYHAWFGVQTLPTLNYTSKKLRKKVWGDKDSIVKKWLRPPFCTDGWRFDVADVMARNDEIQLHHDIWPQIRQSIKEENPQAYILAEDWSDSTEFLNGNEWDSPMNYFASCRPIRGFYGQQDFFISHVPPLEKIPAKLSAKDISEWISAYYARLPFVIRQNLFNLLGSHDISRFHNDPAISKDSVRGAVIMIFTLPGCTNVYYGDEAEIDGRMHNNEGCRYPMPWDKDIESTDSYKLYSKLCKIKTSSEAFKDGGFAILWDEDDIFAYARFSPEEVWITIASSSSSRNEIMIPLGRFGNSFAASKKIQSDVLGEKIEASVNNSILTAKIPAGKAYLLKL